MSIGTNIKKIRTDKKITRKELAEKIEVSEPTISRYENGKREPNIETLNKIARALNVSILELIGSTPLTKEHIFDGIGGKTEFEQNYISDLESYNNELLIEEIVKREIPDISQQDMEHIINEVMNFIQYELSKKLPQYKKSGE